MTRTCTAGSRKVWYKWLQNLLCGPILDFIDKNLELKNLVIRFGISYSVKLRVIGLSLDYYLDYIDQTIMMDHFLDRLILNPSVLSRLNF